MLLKIPYSLKFSTLMSRFSRVIHRPRNSYPAKKVVHVVSSWLYMYILMHSTGLALDHENFIRDNLFLGRI